MLIAYALSVKTFYDTIEELEAQRDTIRDVPCPRCGGHTLRKHGYGRGYISPGEYGIRWWRVRCRREIGGCGHTPKLGLASTLIHHCLPGAMLWAFIGLLMLGCSIKSAWEQCRTRLSLDTGYRFFYRIRRCQPVLRTRLLARAPPPECEGAHLLETLMHLQKVFGEDAAVSKYQMTFQRSFLATT